ncbi:MAG TPA: hypothetical protein VH835_04890 [Dongiaceae bacterium]|jgi:hypothetical protein
MATVAIGRLTGRFLALLILAAAGSAAAMGAGTAMPLTERVELQELQSGFAGVTGTVWTIETDGRFVISRKINEQVTPRAEGTLDAAQLSKIAEALAAADAATLPATIGDPPPVNPRTVILQIGDKPSTLFTAGAVEAGPSGGDAESRLLNIAAAIKDVVGLPPEP